MKACFWVTPLDKNGCQSGDAIPVYKTGYFNPKDSRFHVSLPFDYGGSVRIDGVAYDSLEKALEAYDAAVKELM